MVEFNKPDNASVEALRNEAKAIKASIPQNDKGVWTGKSFHEYDLHAVIGYKVSEGDGLKSWGDSNFVSVSFTLGTTENSAYFDRVSLRSENKNNRDYSELVASPSGKIMLYSNTDGERSEVDVTLVAQTLGINKDTLRTMQFNISKDGSISKEDEMEVLGTLNKVEEKLRTSVEMASTNDALSRER